MTQNHQSTSQQSQIQSGKQNKQFVNESVAKVKQMLLLLQQNDNQVYRPQVQQISISLIKMGQDYNIPEWRDLLTSCTKAIANPQNSEEILINVVIREIKQALELIVKGQSKAIKVSANLREILPDEIAKNEVNLTGKNRELNEVDELEALFSDGENALNENESAIFAQLENLINQPVASMIFAQLENLINQPYPVKVKIIKNPTILIIDDSIGVRELLAATFTRAGYKVVKAKHGQDAWDQLCSGLLCDMILSDIEMPLMNGLQLLENIYNNSELNQIPVAMLTSRSADKHKQQAVKFGAKGYFTKPYLEPVLLEAMGRIIQGENLLIS